MAGHTAYSDEERNIVRAGIGAVRAVLSGADVEAVRRLLYCLAWFMDPYYQNDLGDMAAPLKEALQELNVTTRVADVPRKRCRCWNTPTHPTKYCACILKMLRLNFQVQHYLHLKCCHDSKEVSPSERRGARLHHVHHAG